jgi:hypothetical protein
MEKRELKAYEILIKDIGEMNLCDWLMRKSSLVVSNHRN